MASKKKNKTNIKYSNNYKNTYYEPYTFTEGDMILIYPSDVDGERIPAEIGIITEIKKIHSGLDTWYFVEWSDGFKRPYSLIDFQVNIQDHGTWQIVKYQHENLELPYQDYLEN